MLSVWPEDQEAASCLGRNQWFGAPWSIENCGTERMERDQQVVRGSNRFTVPSTPTTRQKDATNVADWLTI